MSQPKRSAEDVTKEIEALEDLLKSDGFKLHERYAVNEVKGDGYIARMRTAIATKDPTEPRAVDLALQTTAAIFDWPRRRLAELRGQKA